MPLQRREPKLKLGRWSRDDWYYAHGGYRFIKSFFQRPVVWASALNARGAHHVPETGAVILAPNHLSWADPIVIGAAIERPAFYLAKEGVFKNKLLGAALSAFGQIKVDRHVGGNDAAITTALDLLRQGLVVGVFPEGTRSRPQQVKRGKTGVARIAALSGVPVIPIGCDTGDFWPKESKLPRFGRKVYIDIGAPIDLKLRPEDAADKTLMRDSTDRVMDEIRRLYQNCVDARERGERWG